MRTTDKLLAACALALAFVAPVFSAQAAEPLSQQLEERNTYTNPSQVGWSANAMVAQKRFTAMLPQRLASMSSTNVSPASMESGLVQQR